MTDIRFRRLEPYRIGGAGSRMELSLPLPRSPKGRFQRYCPSADCVPRRFQLSDPPPEQTVAREHQVLLRRQPRRPGVTCPYCGNDSDDQSFTAPEDVEAAKQHIAWAAGQDLQDHLEQFARGFNQRMGRNSFVKISMDVKRNHQPKPHVWREDLLRGLTCDLCGREYGVYAIALFCPDCGGRNVHVHFQRELELIHKQLGISENASTQGDDELAYRILGNAHEDVLTALETYLKTLFIFLLRRCAPEKREALEKDARRGNPFQQVDRATALYGQLGSDPFRVLSQEDREFMVVHIKKRHVIGHNLGLADEKFLEHVGHGKEGESVRILADDVRKFATLAYRIVVDGIEASEPEFLPVKTEGAERGGEPGPQ